MRKEIHAVLLSSLALTGFTQISKKEPSPNIIFILADDLGYGDLSCYGQQKFSTPNIDRLAKQGMLFTQHYTGCTVSAPSRSCLMTGLHTGQLPSGETRNGNLKVSGPYLQNPIQLPKCLN